jgi:hypothetical protein
MGFRQQVVYMPPLYTFSLFHEHRRDSKYRRSHSGVRRSKFHLSIQGISLIQEVHDEDLHDPGT